MSKGNSNSIGAFLQDKGVQLKGREDWKFSDTTKLTSSTFVPYAGQPDTQAQLDGFLSRADTHKLVFVNGVLDQQRSRIGDLPAGVTLLPLADMAGSLQDRPTPDLSLPVAALNAAFWQDGLYLEVADGVVFERPVELFYLTDEQAAGTMVSARNVVRAGKDSSLTVVEHFTGPATEAVMNTPLTEVFCDEDAVVRHLKIIRESRANLHFGSTHVKQMARSSFTSREFALSGQSVRRELHLDLDGEGARCDLTALYMGSDKQRLDMRTRVNHNAPGCLTNELYKGLLDGEARSVFDGLIKVARDAQQTEAFQTNRNLVLSDDTVSYSIPRLEIYADDVKCSHGSTTGQLDDDQLFFLRTRGFDPVTARVMLANAFASEILEGVRNDDLRRSLRQEIAQRLGQSSVVKVRS